MTGGNIRAVRFGISIPNFAEPEALLEVARRAEQAGWDGFFLWDHILIDVGAPPPISEPWTVLGAAATITSRIRLGTLVTPVARRRPWVLARQVTTVDHLSHGRTILGVGLGVPPEAEYAAFGEPAHQTEHAALLDEGLDVIAALWTGGSVTHDGPRHHLRGAKFLPRPVQRPRIPIWSAAVLPARAGVRRAARWDGIVPITTPGDEFRPVTPEEVAGLLEEITSHRPAGGPFDVVVWTGAEDAASCAEYEQAGTTWLIHGPRPGEDWLDDALGIAAGGPPS